MDKLIEAFARWPAKNQLLFAVTALALAAALAILSGMALTVLIHKIIQSLAVLCRGWPQTAGRDPAPPRKFVEIRSRALAPPALERVARTRVQIVEDDPESDVRLIDEP